MNALCQTNHVSGIATHLMPQQAPHLQRTSVAGIDPDTWQWITPPELYLCKPSDSLEPVPDLTHVCGVKCYEGGGDGD
jgi:hypothetical protein